MFLEDERKEIEAAQATLEDSSVTPEVMEPQLCSKCARAIDGGGRFLISVTSLTLKFFLSKWKLVMNNNLTMSENYI